MRFERTDSFASDFRRLKPGWKAMFRAVIPAFNAACDAWLVDPSTGWPAALRVKPVRHAPGIWEMTWSFSGPDGRATFEWVRVGDDEDRAQPVLRWRRIGTHEIVGDP